MALVQEIPPSNNRSKPPPLPRSPHPSPRVNLVYFWEPLSLEAESSHTLRARCPASAPAILDTSRLLIATAAFIELPPNGGQRQVQSQERRRFALGFYF